MMLVLLDNLESVMDAQRETLTDSALHEALSTVLTAPEHAITMITTTRVTPAALLKVEPARQRQLRLNEGLGSPDAQIVLRELDDDGRLGLRDASDDLLDGLRQHTRGFPRALEAVKAILDGDETLTPGDLFDRTRHLHEDQVVQVLVGEAYELLDDPAQQVMQALSVYPSPVSATGVDFLLRPVNPTTDAAPILTRLVRRQLVRFHEAHYYLHPIDRDYARGHLPPGHPGDPAAAFTLAGLQARAAEYYAQIRMPRESWRSLEDVQPQLAEFELRCDAGDYNAAAAVLVDIDFDYLQVWGHYSTLLGLHKRIHGRITDPDQNVLHLSGFGTCLFSMGEYRQAIEVHTQGLALAREAGDRWDEGAALGNLANCHTRLGEYRRAIDLQTQALAITRETGDRGAEARNMSNLGNCYGAVGEHGQAADLMALALGIAREVGERQDEGMHLGNLGLCHASVGEYEQAVDLYTQSLAIAREVGDLYGEANVMTFMSRALLASDDARQAVTLLEQAVRIADSTGDLEPAAAARSLLARARLYLGAPEAALAVLAERREAPYPLEEPALCLLDGLALLELRRLTENRQVLTDTLAAADALLALADRNVAALEVRALALSGLAVVAGDPARAAEAVQAFARARADTRAPGVVAETRRLLGIITAHDQSGVLAAFDSD